MPGHKQDRAAEDIKRELTDIFRSVKDPRVDPMLSVVKLDLSRDMSSCKVYVSSLGGAETAKASVEGLRSATGYVRHELSARLKLRHTPELKFIPDDSIEFSARISDILGSGDKEKHED